VTEAGRGGGGATGAVLGVILAAGRGMRLAPFSERSPKPMLPVLGKPLLVYHIERLRDIGVRRIVIVIGHLGSEIMRSIGDGSRWDVTIDYVDQTELLGIGHAVAAVESHIDRPFFLLLGDIFILEGGDLGAMLEILDPPDTYAVLAVKEEPDPTAIQRNFVVLEDEGGFVNRVIEKPRHPQTNLKGCGIYLFDPVVFDAVRRTPRTAARDEYEITESIQIMIDDGYGVRAARVIEDDLNVSDPRDLLTVNLRTLGDDVFIGEDVHLAEGCRIERSLIMEGARVEHPIAVQDSMIFPHTVVSGHTDISRRIVTPDGTIDCE
jgi:NDP-sugar pyrophosphorylase family protein